MRKSCFEPRVNNVSLPVLETVNKNAKSDDGRYPKSGHQNANPRGQQKSYVSSDHSISNQFAKSNFLPCKIKREHFAKVISNQLDGLEPEKATQAYPLHEKLFAQVLTNSRALLWQQSLVRAQHQLLRWGHGGVNTVVQVNEQVSFFVQDEGLREYLVTQHVRQTYSNKKKHRYKTYSTIILKKYEPL